VLKSEEEEQDAAAYLTWNLPMVCASLEALMLSKGRTPTSRDEVERMQVPQVRYTATMKMQKARLL